MITVELYYKSIIMWYTENSQISGSHTSYFEMIRDQRWNHKGNYKIFSAKWQSRTDKSSWNWTKGMLRGWFIALNDNIRKEAHKINDPRFPLKKLEKKKAQTKCK